jgi:hypothetical protein
MSSIMRRRSGVMHSSVSAGSCATYTGARNSWKISATPGIARSSSGSWMNIETNKGARPGNSRGWRRSLNHGTRWSPSTFNELESHRRKLEALDIVHS